MVDLLYLSLINIIVGITVAVVSVYLTMWYKERKERLDTLYSIYAELLRNMGRAKDNLGIEKIGVFLPFEDLSWKNAPWSPNSFFVKEIKNLKIPFEEKITSKLTRIYVSIQRINDLIKLHFNWVFGVGRMSDIFKKQKKELEKCIISEIKRIQPLMEEVEILISLKIFKLRKENIPIIKERAKKLYESKE